jgi:hypothetical protein
LTLGAFPNDLLHETFQYVSIDDLFALSATSRLLHFAANIYLYRDLDPIFVEERSLTKCLMRNTSNMQYIRNHVSYEARYLTRLISHPLTLHSLEIDWTDFYYPNPYPKFLRARHPNLWLQHLILQYKQGQCNHQKFLLERLDTFEGLTRLTLVLTTETNSRRRDFASILDVLDSINCPQLQQLILDGTPENAKVDPRKLKERFPNLVSLDIGRWLWFPEPVPTEDMWELFLALRKQSIYLRVRYYEDDSRYEDLAVSFYDKILQEAMDQNVDPTRLVHFHVDAACYFNRYQSSNNYLSVALQPPDEYEDDFENICRVLRLLTFVTDAAGYSHTKLIVNIAVVTYSVIVIPTSRNSLEITLDAGIADKVMSECSHLFPNVRHIDFQRYYWDIWFNQNSGDVGPFRSPVVFWRNNWIRSTGDLYESIDYEIEESIPISRKSMRRPRVLDDPIQIADLKDINVQRLFIRSPKLEWVSYSPADLWYLE